MPKKIEDESTPPEQVEAIDAAEDAADEAIEQAQQVTRRARAVAVPRDGASRAALDDLARSVKSLSKTTTELARAVKRLAGIARRQGWDPDEDGDDE